MYTNHKLIREINTDILIKKYNNGQIDLETLIIDLDRLADIYKLEIESDKKNKEIESRTQTILKKLDKEFQKEKNIQIAMENGDEVFLLSKNIKKIKNK